MNKEAAKEFAKERDANFDKARSEAEAVFAKEFKPDAAMAAPNQYLKLLFVKMGSKIVKEMMPAAKKAGKAYASRLGQAEHKDTEV